MNHFERRSAAFVLLLALCGCDTTGGESGVFGQVMGQVVGDAARTTVGNATYSATSATTQQLCGSSTWGMCQSVTSTMVTGFSSEFVKRMTQGDVKAAAAARDESIRTGQPQQWSNPETGATGIVETQPAPPQPPKPTPVKVQKERVAPEAVPPMDAVGEEYVVTSAKGANVRGGPATTYAVVESLKPNEQIMAIARVRGQDWFMVGRGQVGIGYVAAALIGPLPRNVAPAPQAPPPAPDQVQEVKVDLAAECYSTKQKVTLRDGTSEEATVTSCRTPTGWAQV